MSVSLTRISLVPAVALAVLALVLAPTTPAAAQDASDAVLVGTYNPQAVAQAAGLQQRMMEQMQGLQSRAQEAQQSGDQAAMQQIQQEAQQIQQETTEQFIADLDAVMAEVAEETGADVIATDVGYVADGFETIDVTQALVDAMTPDETTPDESAE